MFSAFLILAIVSMLGAMVFSVAQFGGGRMGSPGALPASGTVVQNFQNMPPGAVDTIYLNVTVTGKSDGAAFNLSVLTGANAGAEGADDVDDMLNAIFSRLDLYWEPDNLAGSLTPAQWRTILGAFSRRDFGGSFRNGVAVPAVGAAAQSFVITIPFPVSLKHYFFDGQIFSNGSARLKTGQLHYNMTSNAPTVALTNGNFVATSVAAELNVELGAGTEGDIGATWRVTRIAGLPTVTEMPAASGGRLLLAEATPAASSTITVATVGDFAMWTPAAFASKYQTDKLPLGGYDITNRLTPFIFVEDDMRVDDMDSTVNKSIRIDATGPASLTVYDVQAIVADGITHQRVSTVIGGGGAIDIQHPAAPSKPIGSVVRPTLAALMPKRVVPAGAGAGVKVSTPREAGLKADKQRVGASSAKAKFLKMFGK